MLTFSQSFYKQFTLSHKPHGLRVGQWFYQWANLDKVQNTKDKMWCDMIYEVDGYEALIEIECRVDWSQ